MDKATFEELQKTGISDLTQFQLIEAFYKGTDAIANFAEEVMIPILRGQLSLNDKETALVGTYYRMYAWIESMVAMNKSIHFQGAAAATRSLFELLIDIKILSSDTTGEMVKKFHAFPEVEKFRIAKKIVNFCNEFKGKINIDDALQQDYISRNQSNDKNIIQYWGITKNGKPNRPDHWSGLKIEDRAKQSGLKYHEQYIDIYPKLSWQIHSGSTGYVGLSEEGLRSIFASSHGIAQQAFLEATVICGQELRIKDALDWFYKSIDELRLVPGKVLVEEQIKILQQRNNKT